MAHASGELPIHLNNHHLNTLSVIFAHPVSHNVRWHDALSLMEAVGDVEERHDGRFKVTIGAETEVLDHPRDKDLGTEMVVDLRRMLANAGFDPKPKGEEI